MKKTLAILLAAMMALTALVLASCGNTPASTGEATTDGEKTEETPATTDEVTEPDQTTEAPATTDAATEPVTTEPVTTEGALDYYEEDLKLYEGDPVAHTPKTAANNVELACKFTVDDSSRLTGILFEQCPTWNTHGVSAFVVELYRWDNDYDNTILSDPIFSAEYTEWEDNTSCDVDFTDLNENGFGPGTYMYVFRGTTSNIGLWACEPIDECEYFENGVSSDAGFQVCLHLLVAD